MWLRDTIGPIHCELVLYTYCWGSLDEALGGLTLLGSGGRDCIPSKGLETIPESQPLPKTERRAPSATLTSVIWRWELYRTRRAYPRQSADALLVLRRLWLTHTRSAKRSFV
jgi:hypothetical protein